MGAPDTGRYQLTCADKLRKVWLKVTRQLAYNKALSCDLSSVSTNSFCIKIELGQKAGLPKWMSFFVIAFSTLIFEALTFSFLTGCTKIWHLVCYVAKTECNMAIYCSLI